MNNQRWVNWSKTVSSFPESIIYPKTQDALIEAIKNAISNNTKVKIVGSGHSCSKIAETHSGILISLDNLTDIINYNKELLCFRNSQPSWLSYCNVAKKKQFQYLIFTLKINSIGVLITL